VLAIGEDGHRVEVFGEPRYKEPSLPLAAKGLLPGYPAIATSYRATAIARLSVLFAENLTKIYTDSSVAERPLSNTTPAV
jgi:hypothetical protein